MGRGWGGERTTIILLRHMGKPGQQAIDRLVKKRLFTIFFLFYRLSFLKFDYIFFFLSFHCSTNVNALKISNRYGRKLSYRSSKVEKKKKDEYNKKKKKNLKDGTKLYVLLHRRLENYLKYWEVSLIGKLINRKNYSTKQRRNFQYILESSKAATTRGQISSGCAPHCEAIVNADIMFPSITRHIRVRLSGFISDTGLTAVARWATTPRKPRFAKHFHQEMPPSSCPCITAIINPRDLYAINIQKCPTSTGEERYVKNVTRNYIQGVWEKRAGSRMISNYIISNCSQKL